jgi:glycosyltransferase involved in cell wall biosynthesis
MKPDAISKAAKLKGKRILIVSAYLPPYAPTGSIRVPALAKHWLAQGADVRIIASKTSLFPNTESNPISADRIAYVSFGRAVEPAPLQGVQPAYKAWIASRFPATMKRLQLLSRDWRDLWQVPDPFLPWVQSAINHARVWCSDWKPDLLYSSGPPHSGHLVAKALAQECGCQWIAEMRDPWSSNPYSYHSSIVKLRNRIAERATLKTANALVTLTRFEQHMFQSKYNKPIVFVRNGFTADTADQINMSKEAQDEIVITYAGVLYNGRRDPRKLLDALRLLGDDAKSFRFKIIGDAEKAEQLLADYADLRSQIDILPQMSHSDVLKIYGKSDILLLLRWDDPRERAFVAGKLFEYIAARRPILCMGESHGEAADIIRDNGFGFVAQSTEEAAFALRGFFETKKRHGYVPILPKAPTLAFTRACQFEQLDRFIDTMCLTAHS